MELQHTFCGLTGCVRLNPISSNPEDIFQKCIQANVTDTLIIKISEGEVSAIRKKIKGQTRDVNINVIHHFYIRRRKFSLNCFHTSLIRVTQYGFLLGSQARTGPVLHPRRHGELVREVLGDHVIWDVGRLSPSEPVDEVAVSAAVGEKRRRPVCRRAGGRKEVGAARRRACSSSEIQKRRTLITIIHPLCDTC